MSNLVEATKMEPWNDMPSLKTSESDPTLANSATDSEVDDDTTANNNKWEEPPKRRRSLFWTTQRNDTNSNNKSPNNKDATNNNNTLLPKSDPPKLVLARTKFLLEQGETVLPPYHPFKANSECIAVFCKTGRWSTLQASVFLHSTAICNVKSSVAVTLGVAASMPYLAPAIAGMGLLSVGAPYVILNQSKEYWQQERFVSMNWCGRKPIQKFFVDCILQWAKLDEAKQRQQTNSKTKGGNDTPVTEEREPPPQKTDELKRDESFEVDVDDIPQHEQQQDDDGSPEVDVDDILHDVQHDNGTSTDESKKNISLQEPNKEIPIRFGVSKYIAGLREGNEPIPGGTINNIDWLSKSIPLVRLVGNKSHGRRGQPMSRVNVSDSKGVIWSGTTWDSWGRWNKKY